MFNSWGRSWQLVKASWAVLQSDRELLLFPVISGIITILISVVMFIPAITWTLFTSGGDGEVTQIFGMIGTFIFYLVTYTITIYFNTALIGAAMIRLDGGDPTVQDGIKIANSHLGNIVAFAAMSATVGVIVRMLQERGGIIGSIIGSLGGFAWNVATFLVIPIMIVEGLSPWDAVKNSTAMLRETWGEQLTGSWSIGGIFFLFYFLVLILAIALGFAAFALTESVATVIAVVIFAVLVMVMIGVVQGALSGVYQAAIYRYAATGSTPDNFDVDLIQGAFKQKRKRG